MALVTADARSAFERAVETLKPDQRAAALRMRDAFKLRDDDAVWLFCGIAQEFETLMDDTSMQCVAAIDGSLMAELAGSATRAPATPLGQPSPRVLYVGTLLSLLVTWAVLVGSSAFALGTQLKYGRVPWASDPPADALTYAAGAVLNAPVGGFFAIVGLVLVAPFALALEYRRRRRPVPVRQ